MNTATNPGGPTDRDHLSINLIFTLLQVLRIFKAQYILK